MLYQPSHCNSGMWTHRAPKVFSNDVVVEAIINNLVVILSVVTHAMYPKKYSQFPQIRYNARWQKF